MIDQRKKKKGVKFVLRTNDEHAQSTEVDLLLGIDVVDIHGVVVVVVVLWL
jgi:hypothetical protein